MAHFAKIIKKYTNIVEGSGGMIDEDASTIIYTVDKVLVVDNSILLDENNNEVEQKGIDFLMSVEAGEYKQCSYNGSFRGKYPSKGDLYNPSTDVFESNDEDENNK